MWAHLVDVSIRSLLLAFPAGGVLWIFRRRRSAALQHALWAAVVLGMLGLFAFGQALPRLNLRVLKSPVSAPPPVVPDVSILDAPPVQAEVLLGPVATTVPATADWREIAVYVYASISVFFMARFALGMFLVRKLTTASNGVTGESRFRQSETIAVPLTVGWFRPKILLPSEWRDWEQSKLDAVLMHEGAHARRRDGLIAALAAINRSVLWFHPLAWWLERRLALLAEQACDEACIAETGDRDGYAQLLVEMAQVVDGSNGRLRGHALTMAAGSHLVQRIESILREGRTFTHGLSKTGWAIVVLCGVPVVLCAGAVTLDQQASLLPLEIPRSLAPPVPLLAQARSTSPSPAPAPKLEFEVASVRPSAPMPPRPNPGNSKGGGGLGGIPIGVGNTCGIPRFSMDRGRVGYTCVSLRTLIGYAFGVPQNRIKGPDTIMDKLFDIVAKLPPGGTEDQVPRMFQTLLADRFKLTVHRGSDLEEVSALIVSKGGLKLDEASPDAAEPDPSADQPSSCPPQNFSCAPNVLNVGSLQTRSTPLSPTVRVITNARMGKVLWTRDLNGSTSVDAPNTTVAGLADALTVMGVVGQRVVDMTGLKGRYQVVLELSIDMNKLRDRVRERLETQQLGGAGSPEPAASDSAGGLIREAWRVALRKLGLELEPRKAPVETVVIDHLEKTPTEN